MRRSRSGLSAGLPKRQRHTLPNPVIATNMDWLCTFHLPVFLTFGVELLLQVVDVLDYDWIGSAQAGRLAIPGCAWLGGHTIQTYGQFGKDLSFHLQFRFGNVSLLQVTVPLAGDALQLGSERLGI